ncbi:MAG: hypothetical protein ACI3XM_07485 [Eubacteriales bacterium]
MKRQTLAAIMSVILLAAVSCGNPSQEPAQTAADTNTPQNTTETELSYPDHLPADLDYNGESVSFLYREEIADEFYVEEADADIVHDAIYESMRSVEERLNVDIVVYLRPGHLTNARNDYMNHISNAVQAGDKTYDWVDLMIGNTPLRAQEGIFLNLLDNPMLDLSQPWYIPNLTETVSILDQVYFVSGDASLGYLKCAFCMYFNQTLAENYDIGDLYQVVEDGKWTLDKLMEVAVTASQDIDNNGKYTLDDKLGFVVHDSNHPKGFVHSTDAPFFTKETDGNWAFTFGDQHDFDVAEKLYQLKSETLGVFFFNGTNAVAENISDYQAISSKFCNDEIFIISAEMDDVISQFRSMQSNYGILPYPKYDEAQESYYTASRNTHNAFSMLTTCENTEMAGAVLEALSASNYQKVLPTYFEVALKTKYASDNKSAQIFDIIHDSMILDFGYIYGHPLGGIYDKMAGEIFNNPEKLASMIASNQKSVQKAYEKYLATIEANINNN